MRKIIGGVRNYAVASQPFPLGLIPADKRLRYAHQNHLRQLLFITKLYTQSASARYKNLRLIFLIV